MTVFWDFWPCSLVEGRFRSAYCLHHQALVMEAISTIETAVNFYQDTRHSIPEDRHLHTRRRENLKSHL
jgi:hypothetical protein